jgi:uncharacterized protein
MPTKTEYVQGTPNWVDLQTTDQSAAKEFYASLLGNEDEIGDGQQPRGGTSVIVVPTQAVLPDLGHS